MSKKDTDDISNIYQKMLNEVKFGSSLSRPIQSGIPSATENPASTVVIKKKIKRKKRIFEGFVGGFLQGMELAKKGKL
jgi:hypothetical protein